MSDTDLQLPALDETDRTAVLLRYLVPERKLTPPQWHGRRQRSWGANV